MTTLQHLISFLTQTAPLELAESWDNTGLLLGDPNLPVERVLTCLTLTQLVADEAIRERAQLIITHHPILFRPIQKLTTLSPEGDLVLKLARHQVAVYSPHTAYDSARAGINQQWANLLGLTNIQPLRPTTDSLSPEPIGAGRFGSFPTPQPLAAIIHSLRTHFHGAPLRYVGNPQQIISAAAVACGAGGDFLADARAARCQLLVTGEARFHSCVEAQTSGIALILLGHFESERPAMVTLADTLQTAFPQLKVSASFDEPNPISWSIEKI